MNKRTLSVLMITAFVVFATFVQQSAAVPPPSQFPELLEMKPKPESPAPSEDEMAAPVSAVVNDTGFAVCEFMTIQFAAGFGGSDCWGWEAPDGTEYAIMGMDAGVIFINANTGEIIDTVLGPTLGCGGTMWRDMTTFGNYCYCVSECSGLRQGMMIMDMSFLPDSVHYVTSHVAGPGTQTSHNMIIDTSRGFAYLVNPNTNGVRVIDLTNPVSPIELSGVSVPNIHDMFARNDTLWVAESSAGSFSIWDMANKSIPNLIARVNIPSSGLVHNIWPSGDGRHLATTEETVGKTVKIWNVEDLQNISLEGEYLGPSGLAHNAHFVGDTLYVSHYESGVRVLAIADPLNPVEIARYDTFAGNGSSFSGAWGVFPHTASGKVYVSNLDGRLFILQGQSFQTTDTMIADTVVAAPATKTKVDISVSNSFTVSKFIIPIEWSGPYNLLFDSVSTFGLRTENFEISLVGSDFSNSRAVWKFATPEGMPPLEPGTGPVASIYFRVPSSASGAANSISIDRVGISDPTISNDCFSFVAPNIDGAVTLFVPSDCCATTTGNVDNDPGDKSDIADLTFLIDHLFISFVPLVCPEEANIDGDLAGAVDIADLTFLIDHLFISFTPTADCLE